MIRFSMYVFKKIKKTLKKQDNVHTNTDFRVAPKTGPLCYIASNFRNTA